MLKIIIDKLLEQTGQSGMAVGRQFSDAFNQQMTMVLKNTNPKIDPRAFEIVKEEITAMMAEEMVANTRLNEMLYPIYDKHFTVDELNKLVEFNNTDFGKKMIRIMPLVTQESMAAGQAFGQSLAPLIQERVGQRLKAEGIKVE